jgi:hypothetical protein
MGQISLRTHARRLSLLAASVFAVAGIGAVTAQAAPPQIQETVPVESVLGGSIVDPCNGQTITWTGNVHLLGGETTDAAGGAVFYAQVNFNDVKGTDPTGTQYTIPLHSNDIIVFAPSSPTLPTPNVETHTIRLNINSDGSSPNAYEDAVAHYTVTPDGKVAVAFDKVDTGCSG